MPTPRSVVSGWSHLFHYRAELNRRANAVRGQRSVARCSATLDRHLRGRPRPVRTRHRVPHASSSLTTCSPTPVTKQHTRSHSFVRDTGDHDLSHAGTNRHVRACAADTDPPQRIRSAFAAAGGLEVLTSGQPLRSMGNQALVEAAAEPDPITCGCCLSTLATLRAGTHRAFPPG